MKLIDYRGLMGVEDLARSSRGGLGVRIAILDSGIPYLNGLPACGDFHAPKGWRDVFGHATAVASMLFGCNGVRGVCEGALPMYAKVLDDSGQGSVKSVVDGIYRSIDWDVDLINLSLGFFRTEKCPRSLEKACEKAFEAGKTVICAAGNDGGPVNWPAALETTICVGSAGDNGLKMPFSSVGEVDFVAPGANLRVLDISGRLKSVSGTSFSSALVTGVAALLVPGIKAENGGYVCMGAVRDALIGISHDIEAPGKDEATGYGMVSGRPRDNTVCMKIEPGFFDRILGKIKSLVGFKSKEKEDGEIV